MAVPEEIKHWILHHDERVLFTIFYIGLSVVLSIVFGLFWLALIVFIHWVLELIAQLLKTENRLLALGNSIWEVKLDIALVFMALWLAVYLDFIFGIAGIGAAGRTAAQLGNQGLRAGSRVAKAGGDIARTTVRFAGWQRAIRATLLTVDDIAQALRVLFSARKRKIKQIEAATGDPEPGNILEETVSRSSWTGKWGKGDYISFGLLLFFFVMILVAPLIIENDMKGVMATIASELKP